MIVRPFDPERDRSACHRIWREVGWLKAGEEAVMDLYLDASRSLVAEVRGEAECLVMAADGSLRHLSSDLSLCAITGVTTSYVGRKQGLAAGALAKLMASEAERGAALFGLGMFEQGFYNQLGYGTGSYLHRVDFDPANLQTTVTPRIPHRLTKDDWQEIHECRLKRQRGHGSVSLLPAQITQADLGSDNPFGLGYRDEATGELTHHAWFQTSNVEYGPYYCCWLAYRSLDQLMELLAMIRTLGDQVRLVKLQEPAGIMIQDLIKQPFKHHRLTEGGKFASGVRTAAWMQFRICDLEKCMAVTKLPFGEVRFNLQLTDPITPYLSGESWKGSGGEYVVRLGIESYAERGTDSALPSLRASVGTFTRLWLGARTASSLAVTDGLEAPAELLREFDTLLCLPSPYPDWDF